MVKSFQEARQDAKKISFEKLLQLQEQMGRNEFNEGVFGISTKRRNAELQSVKRIKTERKDIKRGKKQFNNDDNDGPPIEMSSKRPVPFLGTPRISLRQQKKQQFRDPRFDARCGDYNGAKFRRNFDFVYGMKEKEIGRLRRQMRETEDEQEKEQIKIVLQRLTEQVKQHKKETAEIEKTLAEKQEAELEGKRPQFMKRSDKRMSALVDQYVALKEKGSLEKHLEARRKRQAALSRKKMKM